MKSDNLIKYELKKMVEYSKQTIALSNQIYLSFLEKPINSTQSKKIAELLNNIQNGSLLDIKEINDKVDKIISMSKSTYINSKDNMIDKGEDFIYE
jgi:hypothetical protein